MQVFYYIKYDLGPTRGNNIITDSELGEEDGKEEGDGDDGGKKEDDDEGAEGGDEAEEKTEE